MTWAIDLYGDPRPTCDGLECHAADIVSGMRSLCEALEGLAVCLAGLADAGRYHSGAVEGSHLRAWPTRAHAQRGPTQFVGRMTDRLGLGCPGDEDQHRARARVVIERDILRRKVVSGHFDIEVDEGRARGQGFENMVAGRSVVSRSRSNVRGPVWCESGSRVGSSRRHYLTVTRQAKASDKMHGDRLAVCLWAGRSHDAVARAASGLATHAVAALFRHGREILMVAGMIGFCDLEDCCCRRCCYCSSNR